MLGIIAFIAIFIFAYRAYKAAVDYGRNGILWAIITFVVGFTFQVIIPFIIGFVYVIVIVAKGSQAEISGIDPSAGWLILLNMILIVLSFAAMILILKHLGTIPDDGLMARNATAPPPPPTFDHYEPSGDSGIQPAVSPDLSQD